MADFHILYFTGVDDAPAANLMNALGELAKRGVQSVSIAISSNGGAVVTGISLYNFMMAMPFEIETHNIGNVDSIANVVFLAGSTRFCAPQSTFMFHGVGLIHKITGYARLALVLLALIAAPLWIIALR